ncbi:MAG: hypothetical protein ACOY0T_01710 [Myxococcota bacterium]
MAAFRTLTLAKTMAFMAFAAASPAYAAVTSDNRGHTDVVAPETLRAKERRDELAKAGNTEPTRAPESLSLGGRAFIVPTLGAGALGWGLDEAYSLIPNLAVGGQYLSYLVDQGADPQYCQRCIWDGKAALAFAEGRLWPKLWFTPYVRAGGGLSFINGQRFAYENAYAETDFTLLAEAGAELHHRWFSARVYGFHLAILRSELDRDPFTGLGTQLGARF